MQAPIFVSQLELTEPIVDTHLPPRADGDAYTGVHLLVRVQRAPVGYLYLPADRLDAAAVATGVWRELGSVINERRAQAGLAPLAAIPLTGIPAETVLVAEPAEFPLISVAVCTRDRPESVVQTVRTLAALDYPSYEILVVDNAPSSDATMLAIRENFGADQRVRYLREPTPGTSFARNRALAEAVGDIVAYADDDVSVDPLWLRGVARGFQSAANVAGVTGMIATAEIENEAQLYFHLRQQWGGVCERRVFDLVDNRDDSPIYPYSAGIFGAGANFSVSRTALKDIGGFNEALGGGVPAAGGEDLNLFMRIILSGYQLVYEPTAIVHHRHRSSLSALTKQMRGYGSGATASLFALALANRRARRELPVKVIQGVVRILRLRNPSSDVADNPGLPTGLLKREVTGYALGPWLYLKGVRRNKRLARANTSNGGHR
jgi:glycosyltransferase involved in cell wall biosynthesis